MRTALPAAGVLVVMLSMVGCAPEPVAADAPRPTRSPSMAAPTPSAPPTAPVTPAPTPAAPVEISEVPELTLGYTDAQISAACIPAVEAHYAGTTVTDASAEGPWIDEAAGTAIFEWHTYVPDGVTWTTNTNITFPALCTIDARDPAVPTVTYIGVADI